MWKFTILLFTCIALRASSARETKLPTASIDAGEIIGTTTDLPSSDVAVNQFLGIPFAQSPPERFSPPKPVKKFKETYVAQKRAPACMQQFNYPEESRQFVIDAFHGDVDESEDCLYLNVFAPDTPGDDKPVLFWLYGGSLDFGSASLESYDGSSFAANQGVILVAPNYRTNVFGFSESPEIPVDSRNSGFHDQRLALDWVRRNIGTFGGDPDKVTVFGESAGSTSADLLGLNPPDPIPFHAVISQSGVASVPRGQSAGGKDAWGTLTESLGCNSHADVLKCVRKADASKIKDIIERNALAFDPVVDNVTFLSPPIDRESHQSVPWMVGTTGQEGRIMTTGETDFTKYLETTFPEDPELRERVADAYAIGTPGIAEEFDAIAQVYTELIFQCPTAIAAEDSALADFPTWRYYYNASFLNLEPTEALEKLGLGDLRLHAFHSSEIPMVFGNYPKDTATEEQIALSMLMQTAWADFAKNPHKGPGWPQYGSGKGVNGEGLAVLGAAGGDCLEMIPQQDVDHRCPLFDEIYRTKD